MNGRHLPDSIVFDSPVIVHEDMALPGNFLPWDLRSFLATLL